MERIMSTEDKIRRAKEIYNRRRENKNINNITRVNINEKKDIKLLKKMFIQIIVCFAIYSVFYLVKNNNYIFSEDFLNKSKEILAYDINFQEMYSQILEILKNQRIITYKEDNIEENYENKENSVEEDGIGGAEENTEEEKVQETEKLSQMEQDAIEIKDSINFINPIEGTVTSRFGLRNPSSDTIPSYHTGLDIANLSGTAIHSATDGDVILISSEGDYRKTCKNTDK